jgi:ABC-2 type transport system permease protein
MNAKPSLYWKLNDHFVMAGRCIRHLTRNTDNLLIVIILPVMMMLLFTFVFGGAIQIGGDLNYVSYIVPGILLICIGYSASTTAVSINTDLSQGIVDRFRSMPIAKSAFITGHVIASVFRNTVSTIVLILAAFVLGFSPDASLSEWLAIVLILLLFALAMTYLSTIFGLMAKTPEGAGAFGFFMLFLPYLSSAFVPLETLPGALRIFATYQPISVLVEALRSLFSGVSSPDTLYAVYWCLGILLTGAIIANILFQRKASR